MQYKVGDKILLPMEIVAKEERTIEARAEDGSNLYFSQNTIDKTAIRFTAKTYEQGSADAWKLAKKIYDMNCDAIEEIFGVKGGFYEVIRNFTFEDCRDKIEAYEKEKKIKVGNIVKVTDEGGEGIVTAICTTRIAYVLWKDGSCGDYELSELEATGRKAEGLADLLRQIAE